ncbi:MAG: acyltransferase family protein [Bifidobacteriaceae bacterium]|jgi:peptidoglycan/LPS O-acetylase OafA/YrhL|nr:acyltransferase family protein [Bifidobacteriaceae bacterium]
MSSNPLAFLGGPGPSRPGPVRPQAAAKTVSRARAWWPGVPLDNHANSLNLLRLVFAATVIVAHSFYTGGFGHGPMPGGYNVGGWAVGGFFIISGYLITASRNSHKLGGFLARRIARIYPAFVVNLLIVALVLSPINYHWAHHSLKHFWTTATTPLMYVFGNLRLQLVSYNVAGTPLKVPYPSAWNGSMWTLWYEFTCYLIIGIGLTFTCLRRFQKTFVVVVFLLSIAANWHPAHLATYFGAGSYLPQLLQLTPWFFGGAILYEFRSKLRYNFPCAVLCAAAGTALIAWRPAPEWGTFLSAPLWGYVIMWLAMVLPMPKIIGTQDISYGIYIYGFPVQQVLAMAHVQSHGYFPYMLASLLCTIPCAIASWVIVEKPAMAWVRERKAYPRLHHDATPSRHLRPQPLPATPPRPTGADTPAPAPDQSPAPHRGSDGPPPAAPGTKVAQ